MEAGLVYGLAELRPPVAWMAVTAGFFMLVLVSMAVRRRRSGRRHGLADPRYGDYLKAIAPKENGGVETSVAACVTAGGNPAGKDLRKVLSTDARDEAAIKAVKSPPGVPVREESVNLDGGFRLVAAAGSALVPGADSDWNAACPGITVNGERDGPDGARWLDDGGDRLVVVLDEDDTLLVDEEIEPSFWKVA